MQKLIDMTEEDHLKAQLRSLQESYARSAKPIIDRLVAIESMKPPAPVIFNAADLPAGLLAELRGLSENPSAPKEAV